MKNKQVTQKKKKTKKPVTLESLADSIDTVSANVDHLTISVAKGFAGMYSEMNVRFKEVDKRFEQIDRRFESMDKRFDQVDDRMDGMEDRLIRIENNHGARLEILEQRL